MSKKDELLITVAFGGLEKSPPQSVEWKDSDGAEYVYEPTTSPDDTKRALDEAKSLADFYNNENERLCGLLATMSRNLSAERAKYEEGEKKYQADIEKLKAANYEVTEAKNYWRRTAEVRGDRLRKCEKLEELLREHLGGSFDAAT